MKYVMQRIYYYFEKNPVYMISVRYLAWFAQNLQRQDSSTLEGSKRATLSAHQ